ncbi:AAA domain-containing protein [Fusarium sp. LHS14.1]|nr:AAA domain-containing protein [Fusarium sp. LHS14.1]
MWRIDHSKTESQRDLAYRVLEWLTRAKRALTSWELRHALAVELDSEEGHLDEDNLSEEDELVSSCAGLVIVDKASGIIRLVHYTAQDFFEKTQEQFFPGDEGGITSICLKYTSFDGLRGACASDEDYESRLTGNPFYSYAAQQWGQHARRADMSKVLDSITQLLGEPYRVDAMTQTLFTRSPEQVFQIRYSGTGMTALSWAAAKGHTGVVRFLLEHDTVDITMNMADENGYTPLHVAARNGHTATVEFLVGKGAKSQATDRHGRTPLSWAAGEGHTGVVSALLTLNLDEYVDMADEKGRSPLLLGAQRGHHNVILLLLAAGAAANKTDNLGRTPLSWAVRYPHVVEILLQAKADIDAFDTYWRSSLSYSAARGCEKTVSLLLERGANANWTDKEGQTPLAWARIKGNEEIASLLLQHGRHAAYTIDDNEGLATPTEHIWGTNGENEGLTACTEYIWATNGNCEILDPRYRVVSADYFQPGAVGS